MEDHRDAALHVGRSGRVEYVVVEPLACLERVIGGKHRVHVAGQQQASLRLRPDAQDEVRPVLRGDLAPRRIDRDDRSGLAQFDLARKRGERLDQRIRLPAQPGEVTGARVDCAPSLGLREHRRLVDTRGEGALVFRKLFHSKPT